jgi:hypothetical protein
MMMTIKMMKKIKQLFLKELQISKKKMKQSAVNLQLMENRVN